MLYVNSMTMHPTSVRLDTVTRLLLRGWNLQQYPCTPVVSLITRKHFPDDESHNRHIPSDDTDTMKSFEIDQSKSMTHEIK